MSRQIGIDCIRCKPTPRPAHTEYSLEYHPTFTSDDFLKRREVVETLETKFPEFQKSGVPTMYDAFDFDFMWGTHDGFVDWKATGRITDLGHAVYAADGSDMHQPNACPFTTPEEVWAFDPIAEYGITPFDELVQKYEALHQDRLKRFPHQLCTGGYYKTVVSGASQTFGWDMFLEAAADRAKFAKVLERYGAYTLHHARAWAKTSIEAYIQHDDIMWTSGIFMHPDIYRKVIFPIYKELWKPLKAAGIKVLFCTDGTADGFWEDIADAGADGFIFEPTNDFDRMVKTFGGTHCIVGSKVDCRTMTLGTWEQVKSEVDATFDAIRGMNGIMLAVGNHIPANISDDMIIKYMDYLREKWK